MADFTFSLKLSNPTNGQPKFEVDVTQKFLMECDVQFQILNQTPELKPCSSKQSCGTGKLMVPDSKNVGVGTGDVKRCIAEQSCGPDTKRNFKNNKGVIYDGLLKLPLPTVQINQNEAEDKNKTSNDVKKFIPDVKNNDKTPKLNEKGLKGKDLTFEDFIPDKGIYDTLPKLPSVRTNEIKAEEFVKNKTSNDVEYFIPDVENNDKTPKFNDKGVLIKGKDLNVEDFIPDTKKNFKNDKGHFVLIKGKDLTVEDFIPSLIYDDLPKLPLPSVRTNENKAEDENETSNEPNTMLLKECFKRTLNIIQNCNYK